MSRYIHPFPARMAPELAVAELKMLKPRSVVLDPMTGSGTVISEALALGHRAIGFDMDPLAVLMSSVRTTPISPTQLGSLAADVLKKAQSLCPNSFELPWIDQDPETQSFIEYWFAASQRKDLRCIAYVLSNLHRDATDAGNKATADALRLALSRIIITKKKGASLAWDVSHSRPHKVTENSDFEVFSAFEQSAKIIGRCLGDAPLTSSAQVKLGDARRLHAIRKASVDAVLTSPPYLNAIDYMRGHRLSLVWLGYRLSELRGIRTNSIGSEKAPNDRVAAALFKDIQQAMGLIDELPTRHRSMVARYAEDIYHLLSEVSRVLKSSGRAIFVVGNSCLKGVFIRNSEAVIKAASLNGFALLTQTERNLPPGNRYLPTPKSVEEPLGKRMRTEAILTFAHLR